MRALSDIEAVQPEKLRLIIVDPVANEPATEFILVGVVIWIGRVAGGVIPERSSGCLIEIKGAEGVRLW